MTTPQISLEEERIRRGYTVAAFAAFLRVSVGAYSLLRVGGDAIPRHLAEDVAERLGVAPEAIREFARETTPRPAQGRWEVYYEFEAETLEIGTAIVRRVWTPLHIRRPPRSLRRRLDIALRRISEHHGPRGMRWALWWEPEAARRDDDWE